jgi:hypothetical protein
MARVISLEGKQYSFPDDATDDEINAALDPKDTSYAGAIRHGASNVMSDVGASMSETSEEIGGKGTIGQFLEGQGAFLAPKNYQPAQPFTKAEGKTGALSGRQTYDINWGELPRAVVEQIAPMGLNLATGGAAAPLQYYGGMKRQAEADNNGKPLDVKGQLGVAAKTAGLTGLSVLPGLKLRAPLSQTGLRGVTEAVKRPLAVGAGTGAQSATAAAIQGQDPIPAFGTGMATGTALTGTRTPGNVYKAVKYSKFDDTQANAAVANRLATHGANPMFGKSKADEAAMRATGLDLKKDIAAERANARAQNILNQDHEKILDRAQKLENLSREDVAAIAQLGNPHLTSQVSQARVYNMLGKQGKRVDGKFKGGMSSLFDRVVGGNPIWAAAKTAALAGGTGAAASTVIGSGLNAAGTGGALAGLVAKGTPILAGLYGGLRVIDKETGNRNPASSFVKKFGDKGATAHSRSLTPLQFQQGTNKAYAQFKSSMKAYNAGKATQARQAQATTTATRPNLQGLLANANAAKAKYNNMTDRQIADEATNQFIIANPKKKNMRFRYWQGVNDRRLRADALWTQVVSSSPELVQMPDLKVLIKNQSRRADVRHVLEDIKHNVSPQTATAIDSIFTKTAIQSIWGK